MEPVKVQRVVAKVWTRRARGSAMIDHGLQRLAGRAAIVLGAAAAAWLVAQGAHAQSLGCGEINAHAMVSASEQGQTPAQSQDVQSHPLPWSTDLGQQSGQSNAHKQIQAACAQEGASLTVHITGAEWGDVQAVRTGVAPTAMAGWAPVWSTHVTLPPRKQLAISVASSVSYLTCQLVAPGVAMDWGIPFQESLTTVSGARDFDVTLSCASGGTHAISPARANDWVDAESILINLTVVSVGGGPV
jgi:hypothetical protein